jgi:nicotinamidase-related amidase
LYKYSLIHPAPFVTRPRAFVVFSIKTEKRGKMSELLDRARSVLVIIDVQEKLFPAVCERERVLGKLELLIAAAGVFGIPVMLTEQYPSGLGPTLGEIRGLLPEVRPLEKIDFSCVSSPGFCERLSGFGRNQIVLAGIETHICVVQTALELDSRGERVFVAADASSSRRPIDHEFGLRRMDRAGITLMTAESVVYEWLRRAGTEEFKRLRARLKD